MNRRTRFASLSALGLLAALSALSGCAGSSHVARIQSIPPPVDDAGRPMGPMPLAVGDAVGRAVFMNRTALVARGLVQSNEAFATGSIRDAGLRSTGQ